LDDGIREHGLTVAQYAALSVLGERHRGLSDSDLFELGPTSVRALLRATLVVHRYCSGKRDSLTRLDAAPSEFDRAHLGGRRPSHA
jgi:hypothetical protein